MDKVEAGCPERGLKPNKRKALQIDFSPIRLKPIGIYFYKFG